MTAMEIRVAHSPDSDDAFMFYALWHGQGLIEGISVYPHPRGYRVSQPESSDRATYEVTAVSIHAYAYVSGRYALLPPARAWVSATARSWWPASSGPPDEIRGKTIAVPGLMTTAYLGLKLLEPDFEPLVLPFDRIMAAVTRRRGGCGASDPRGTADLWRRGLAQGGGLGRVVVRADTGCRCLSAATPSGAISARNGSARSPGCCATASSTASTTARPPWSTRSGSRAASNRPGRSIRAMYVNDRTLDYGAEGRQAVRVLLDGGLGKAVDSLSVQPEFTD